MLLRRWKNWIRSTIAAAGVAVIAITTGNAIAEQPLAPLIDRVAHKPAEPAATGNDSATHTAAVAAKVVEKPPEMRIRSLAVVIEWQSGSVQKPHDSSPRNTVRTALRKPDPKQWTQPQKPLQAAPLPLRNPLAIKRLQAQSKATSLAATPRKSAKTVSYPPTAKLVTARQPVLTAWQNTGKTTSSSRAPAEVPPAAAKTTAPQALPAQPGKKLPPPVNAAPTMAPAPRMPAVTGSGVKPASSKPGRIIDLSPQEEYGLPGNSSFAEQPGDSIFSGDFKPIGQVSAVIKPSAGDIPTDFAGPKFASAGNIMHLPGQARPWAFQCFHWVAPGSNHKPLYFEEVNLERHGYSYGRILQPYVSGAHFFGTVAILPYKMALDRPCEPIYTLGHYRPGSCAPHEFYSVPFEVYPTLVEAGAITALFVIFP